MTFPGNEKALTNHCLLLIGMGEEQEGCWHHLLSVFYNNFFKIIYLFFLECVCIGVSCPEAWLSSGVWHHTANTAVYDRGDDEICLALSVCAGLPAFFFFFSFLPKLALVEGRDCLGKDVKRICLVAHQLFQQSIKYNVEGRESEPSPFFYAVSFFFLEHGLSCI